MKKMNFENKQILLIAPNFYNYHNEIIKALEKKGCKVTYISEMDETLLYRIARKIFPWLQKNLEQRHLNKIIFKTSVGKFDCVFVIRGGYFSAESLASMKDNLPDARFVMYQWDSLKQNNYLPIIKFFDFTKTFDRADAELYHLNYFPLFYSEKYRNIQNKKSIKKYDLAFIGAQHSDRYEIIKTLDDLFTKHGLKLKVHLYIKTLPLIRELITRRILFKDLRLFKTFSVSVDEIVDIYEQSKAVLDIELNIQNGLSIRTFEVLGGGMKLITTNSNIKKEEFYAPDSIMVINRKNPEIDLKFFDESINSKLPIEKYYIDEWVHHFFMN